jgi:hypothetical protein
MKPGKKVNVGADPDVDDSAVETGFLDPGAEAELGWKMGACGRSRVKALCLVLVISDNA